MRIRWLEDVDLSVVYSLDEKNKIVDEGFEIVEKGEIKADLHFSPTSRY